MLDLQYNKNHLMCFDLLSSLRMNFMPLMIYVIDIQYFSV